MSTILRWSVLAFSTFNLAACAYGSPSLTVPFTKTDGGVTLDASPKDSGKDVAMVKDSGQDEPETDPPPPPQCSLQQPVSGNPQCDSCMGASCCKESNACLGNNDCMDFGGCISECFSPDGGPPDQNCISTCTSQYPAGFQLYDTFSSCADTNCRNDCSQ